MVFIYVLYKIQQAASYFKHQNGKKISHCRNNSKIQSTNCKQKNKSKIDTPDTHIYDRSMTQQSTDRHVAPVRHIMLTPL